MMRNLLIAVLAIALLPRQACPQSQQPSVHITPSPGGLLFVPGSLGPGVDARFVLDTGGGLEVLAPALIQKVAGRLVGHFTAFRMTGERIDVDLYRIPLLRVGPLEKKDAIVAGWDVLDKYKIDGIISANFFRTKAVAIDFTRNLLIFENRKSLVSRRRAGAVLPLRLDDQRGISLDLFAKFTLDSREGECEIDTGSQGPTFNLRYLELLGIDRNGKGVKKSEQENIVGSRLVQYEAAVPAMAMLGAPEVKVLQPKVVFEDIIYDCVVGADFWSGRTVTIDIPDRALIVAHPGN